MSPRSAAGLLAVLLTLSLATAVPAAGAEAGDRPALDRLPLADAAARAERVPAGAVLVRQRGTLTTQSDGTPAPGTPAHRRLDSAVVDMEVLGHADGEPRWFLGGAAVLKAEPPTGFDVDAQVQLMLGHRSGKACEIDTLADQQETSGYGGTRYDWLGYSGDDGYFPSPDKPWSCAAIAVLSTDGRTIYDARVGALTNTYERPRLAIQRIALLGKKQSKLRLVKGVPTQIEVRVRNRGETEARSVVLTGRGKGLKVKKDRQKSLGDGSTATMLVPVTLKRGKATLRLRASARGAAATKTIKVVAIKPPRKPIPGSYRNSSGSVRFQIKGGAVVGWRGTMLQRCGGYGSIPTTQQVTLDFPRVRIPRNGIVQATDSGERYATSLRMKVVGGKVTHGLFRYADRAQCSASVVFTAKRGR